MKIPFPGDQEEIKGVDGKIRYEKGSVDGLDWAPDNDETEISVRIFAIMPPVLIVPDPEKRCSEVERQLRKGLDEAINRLKETYCGPRAKNL